MNRFEKALQASGHALTKAALEILQVNVGKLCNLTCSHCHVEAGPTKTRENLSRETAEAVVRFMDRAPSVHTLDLTGGAPEMNPHFRFLVGEARARGLRVIDRCNLTVFYEPGMDDLPDFLAENRVEVVASLPCYQKDNVDRQRGQGTFDKSVEALRWLNRLGYGRRDDLQLSLVYNPVGAHLPPPQAKLEADYKVRLRDDLGVEFNRLLTITNMPITRYAKYLKAFKQYDGYVELLVDSFNGQTVGRLMCRNTLSVGWDGRLYDCDFNQMLGLQMANGRPLTIDHFNVESWPDLPVKTAVHCFGCTAGAGSGCQGALQESVTGAQGELCHG